MIKRQHEPSCIVGDLLQSKIAEKLARSIRYLLAVAKLPLAKAIEEFAFEGTRSTRARSGNGPRATLSLISATSC